MRRKKKIKLILIIAAGILLTAAACYTVFIAPLLEEEQWVYKEQTVERGVLKAGVTESGSLEYGVTSVLYDLDLDVSDEDEEDEEDEEDDDSDGTGQKYLKIEEVYVRTGERISEGDILYRFTQDSISDVRMLLENAAAQTQAEYAEAQNEYNLSVLEAETDAQILKLNEQYAAAVYETSSQTLDNEITAIQVEIEKRTANISLLQKKLEEATEDYREAAEDFSEAEKPSVEDNSTVNFMMMQKSYLNLQTQYENAKKTLEEAGQALEDNAKEIESLQKRLENASAKSRVNALEADETYRESVINGENARVTYDAEVESLKETLKEAEDEKDRREEQLEAFEAFVGEDGCLYADGEGIVTEVFYEAGDRLRDNGAMLSYTAPDDMTISVDVTQEDIVDLEVGDRVDITFAAYEGASYEGSIRSINTTATSRESNTVSYTVVIAVEGDTTLLYSGMTADIIFVTQQKEDVLYITRKAVMEEDGKSYVYYKNSAGEMERKEIETGMDNGVNIEVLSGLKEGDTIYLASRVNSEDAVMGSGESAGDDGSESWFGGTESAAPDGGSGMEGMPGGNFEDGGIPSGGGRPSGGEMPLGDGRSFGGEMPSGDGRSSGGEMPSGDGRSFGGEMPSGGGR